MSHRLETKLIHAGEPVPRIAGAVNMPIFQSSTFAYGGESSYHDVRYIRLSNTPNHTAVHAKLAALEGAEAALATASGMAAISAVLLTILKPGDHLIVQDCLYGGTDDLVTRDLAELGITHTVVDGDKPQTWEAALRPTTRGFYCETIANPLLSVPDLDAIVRFARAHRLVSVVDNTFASPIGYRPAERGFDLSVHSATKYLNGHTDIVAGAVIGRADLVGKVKHKLDHLGGSIDPHTAWLLHRGMKTLALRFRHQSASSLALAQALAAHPRVTRVHHPGLPAHASHARAKAILGDNWSGMLSFEIAGDVSAADAFLARLQLAVVAPSLGGCETLVTRPATTSHAGLDPEARRKKGITDGLIRVSVGLEAVEDLVDDFGQALA
jgi:cystathionine beta-lyase/cystathionine gamma-synthase